MLNKIDAKIRLKRSTVASTVPTIGASTDHTDGSWSSEDIYSGEMFYNEPDQKLWIGTDTGIREFVLGSTSGNSADIFEYDSDVSGRIKPLIGYGITNTGDNSAIISGLGNTNTGNLSFIGGGYGGQITSTHSSIIGGYNNRVYSNYSSVIGGYHNTITATGTMNFIGNGQENTISNSSQRSVIVGGQYNTISGASIECSIIGGDSNTINGKTNAHIIGSNITATEDDFTYVENLNISNNIKTNNNEAFLSDSVAIGGSTNESSAGNSAVIGGSTNIARGTQSGVFVGSGHTVTHSNSAILGGASITSDAINTAYVDNLKVEAYCRLFVTTVAALPAAGLTQTTGSIIMVSDETGGYVLAFSDGTNWRRVTDRAIVA